jgi:hypothetical protein
MTSAIEHIVEFVIANSALLVVVLALAVSFVANSTARQANALNVKAKQDADRVQFSEKKRELLNEIDTQHTRASTYAMLVAQKIILLNENPHLQNTLPGEYERLKKNLAGIQSLRSQYEKQRRIIEDVKTSEDLRNPDDLLAETRRLTIHLEKDIAHEERGLNEFAVKANLPPGA